MRLFTPIAGAALIACFWCSTARADDTDEPDQEAPTKAKPAKSSKPSRKKRHAEPKADSESSEAKSEEEAEPEKPPVDPKLEEARVLFKDGRKLMADEQYASACSKFEESLKLDNGAGTRFNLAACYEKLGRTASAYALFVKVAEESREAEQEQRETVARGRAEALQPKLSNLEIDVDSPDKKLELRRNDTSVEKADWNSAHAIDPGTYHFKAKAPGKKSWTSTVRVPSGPALIVVHVPKLEDEAKPEPKAAPATPVTSQKNPEDLKKMRTGAYIAGSVGIAGLVAGTTFAIQYATSNNDAKAVCRKGVGCTHEEVVLHDSLVDDAKKAATLSYVSFGVGSVATIGAVILYVASVGAEPASHQEHPVSSLWALPGVSSDGNVGASLGGSF